MSIFSKKISESEIALKDLQEQFDSLNDIFEVSKNEVVTLSEKLATVEGEFSRVNSENETLKLQLKEKDETIMEVAVEASEVEVIASNKAVDIIAGLGVQPLETVEEETPVDNILKFKSLKGAEQQAFYNENKQEILASLKR